MLSTCCGLIVLAVGYAMMGEGLFAAVLMLVNVVLAGVMTYFFWEPAADYLEGTFGGTFMAGTEDHVCLVLFFALFLVVLRLVTHHLARWQVEFNANLDRYGAVLVGLLIGYLVSGFLVCAMETLPLSDRFMGFEPRSAAETPWRRYFPADRVWSAMMRHAGAGTLAWKARPGGKDFYERHGTFDPQGTFELRYLRYRRYAEKDGKKIEPLPWQKEIGDAK